jgi:hypothetical protein
MSSHLPTRAALWTAIDLYLGRAYEGAIPTTVKKRLDELRAAGERWSESSAIELGKSGDTSRIALRLGNSFYPHMKLILDRRPDDLGYLFRADSHDAHIKPPPQSPEHAVFAALRQTNQTIAAAIESDWASAGLPTYQSFLEQDLARRVAGQIADHPVAKVA